MSNAQLRAAPPLPTNIDEWNRISKQERTLNDLVEDLHRELVSNDKYVSYLRAVYDAHAVEGSLAADNVFAAQMIRDLAKERNSEIAKEKIAVISMALGVVLRRYKASRKQRRNMVAGEQVPDDDNHNSRD